MMTTVAEMLGPIDRNAPLSGSSRKVIKYVTSRNNLP